MQMLQLIRGAEREAGGIRGCHSPESLLSLQAVPVRGFPGIPTPREAQTHPELGQISARNELRASELLGEPAAGKFIPREKKKNHPPRWIELCSLISGDPALSHT